MSLNKYSYYLAFALILSLSAGCVPKTVPEQSKISPPVRVLLATLSANETISFTGTFLLSSEEAFYEFGEKNSSLTVEPISDGIHIFNKNRNLLYRNHFPIIFKPGEPTHHFIFKGKEYAGEIHFTQADDGSIYIINQLSLEDYLKGVVPAEIFSNDQRYYQAVKAQAICARTYAWIKINEKTNRLYDLQSSISDQAYTGFARHTRLADQAVDETRGTILTYNGNPAQVYYHSTCGGKLESAQNIFSDTSIAYMQISNDAINDVFSCSASPYFRWIENRSLKDLDSTFYANYNKSLFMEMPLDTINAAFDIKVTERTTGGRANTITISYADTLVELQGYEIRKFFAKAPKRYLPSTLFYLTQESDTTLNIHGAGNGHGVGMCQYGAMNMSIREFQFYHILGKYFPHTELARMY